jgi:four helix bundle protein
MATIRSFEDLECWKVATELRRELSAIVKTFPSEEKYGLVTQIRNASRGVTNCIAEGFGRYHYQEFIRFARMSRGSLFELIDHLIICNDEQYISREQLSYFKSKIQKCNAILNGLIKHLQNRKANEGKTSEPIVDYGINQELVFDE